MIKHLTCAVVIFLIFSIQLFASGSEDEDSSLKRFERSHSFSDADKASEKSKKTKTVTFNVIREVVYFSNVVVLRQGKGFDYAYGSDDRARKVKYLNQDEQLEMDPAYITKRANKFLQEENSREMRKKFEEDRQRDILSCGSFQNYCVAFKECFDQTLANAENSLKILTSEEFIEVNECYVGAVNACLSYEGENPENMRALYIEMLMKRSSFLADLVKYNSERFHQSCTLLSNSLQSLIHMGLFDLTRIIIEGIQTIIAEKMKLAHDLQDKAKNIKRNEHCDGEKCEEFLRSLAEKSNTLMLISAAVEHGRDCHDFIREKFLEQIKTEKKE